MSLVRFGATVNVVELAHSCTHKRGRMFVMVLSVLSLPSPAHREAPDTQELMRIVLRVMSILIHEVQVCSAVDGHPGMCDDATQDLPGDMIGGVGKKLDEVLLCLKLLRNLCAGVERNQDVV